MSTKFLVSSVWPLVQKRGQKEIKDCFIEELSKADEVRISVAYVSKGSLRELNKWISRCNIRKVCLVIGMYMDNLPQHLYKFALDINEEWQQKGIGEIRITKNWRNHEKLYCFFKNNQMFSIIAGSANLSFLHDRKYPQHETGFLIKDPEALKAALEHINDLLTFPGASENIRFIPSEMETYKKNF